MPFLNLSRGKGEIFMSVVAALLGATLLIAPPARAIGEVGVSAIDHGVSTEYDVGGGDCEDGREYSPSDLRFKSGQTDPVGILFRGPWAGPTNVSEYVTSVTNPDWGYTENYGAQSLYVRNAPGLNGNYLCVEDKFSNASQAEIPGAGRFHVRLWNIPYPEGPYGAREVETISTPHAEFFIPTSQNSNCHTKEIAGVTVGGNHAILPGGLNHPIPGGGGATYNSGFDDGREILAEDFQYRGFETKPEYWGNTQEFHQCNDWMAGSHGRGWIIWVKRRLHALTRKASLITTKGADLNGRLISNEPQTKVWFGIATHPSSGVSGYTRTAMKTFSGPQEITLNEPVSNLSAATTYYARLFAENPEGIVEEGGETKFTTCGTSLNESVGASNPRVIASCRGTIDDFFRTPTGELGHDWYDTAGSGWHSGNLPGTLASAPDAVAQENGTIDVFYKTPTGELGHNWYDTAGSGWRSGNLPGPVASAPDATVQPNGTIDVFFKTPNGELGHDWFDTAGSIWRSSVLPGPVASAPRAVAQANGTVDVFFKTPNGELGHDWYDTGTLGWRSGNLPGPIAAGAEPQPLVQPNGTVDVFFRTTSGVLGHDWKATAPDGWASGNLPGPVAIGAEPHPTVQPNGTIDVFFRTPVNQLGHDWYDTGSSGWQSGSLPGTLESEPAAAAQPNGTVDVVFRTTVGELGHDWYDPGSSGWQSGNLPGPVAADPKVAAQYDGTIDVMFRTPENSMGHDWFDTGGVGWLSGKLPGTIGLNQPSVVMKAVTAITATGATLNASINPQGKETTYQFEYGTSTSYGMKAPATAANIGTTPMDVSVGQALTGLTPNTTYHYRVVAKNVEGTTYGPDATFVPREPPPAVSTLSATRVGSGGAFLGANIRSEESSASYYFEYGKTASYGSKAPTVAQKVAPGASPVFVSSEVGGLEPLTTYHYRVVATNATGTSYGADQVFTTARGLRWRIRNSLTPGNPDFIFAFGTSGQTPVVGDWNGDGVTTPGTYEQSTGVWRLRNSNSSGPAEVEFQYGGSQFAPIVGDWDGNGTTTVGLYEPKEGRWQLRNLNSAGAPSLNFTYGGSQFAPVVGDWDANVTTTVGLFEPKQGRWELRNANSAGVPNLDFTYGGSQFRPVVGDWDGNGSTTIGLFEPIGGNWSLRNSNTGGNPEVSFQYGGSQFSVVVGDWNGDGTETIATVLSE